MQKKARLRVVSLLLCCMTVLTVMTAALMIRPNSAPYLPADPTIEGLTFTDNGQGYTVTNYVGSSRDVLIPSEYEGKAVTVFSSKAFANVERDWGDGPVQLPNDWFDDSLGQIEVDTVTIRNKKIVFDENANTIPDGITIYGYEGSTAQAYAAKYNKEFVAIPEIRSASITLGADITVYYRVVLPEAFRDSVMHFTANSRQATAYPIPTASENEFLFAFEGLTPQMMGEVIHANLVLGGVTVASKSGYSVLQYCKNMKGKITAGTLAGYSQEQCDALNTLLADLLEYGANAQLYVNYKTDKLVNDGITGQSTFTAIPDTFALQKPAASTAEDGTKLIGAYAKLDNLIRLNFIVATTDINRVTLKIDGLTLTAEDFLPYADASVYGIPAYVVSAPAVAAVDLEKVSTISLCVDDAPCQSMEYGVITYLHSKQNDANANLKALVRSIRNYGLSAVAYKDLMALQVVKNGATSYRVVYSASASQAVVDAVNELTAGVKKTTGVTLTAVTDATAASSNNKEILVGSTNRAASAEVAATLNPGQYGIVTKGNQIVIAGATDDACAFGVYEFLRLYAGYTSAAEYETKSTIVLSDNTRVVADASISDRIALFVMENEPSYLDDLTRALTHVSETLTVYPMDTDFDTVFDIGRTGLVIIVGADRTPGGMVTAVKDYMSQAGRVLTLGGPLFETDLYQVNNKWVSKEVYVDTIVSGLTKKTEIEVSDQLSFAYIHFATNNAQIHTQTSTVPNQPTIAKQISHYNNNLQGWDILRFPNVNGLNSSRKDVDAVCLWAKKNPGTVTESILVLVDEIIDDAGNTVSWYKTIELTDQWKYYVIPDEEFEYCHKNRPPKDYVRTEQVDLTRAGQLNVGFDPDYMNQYSGKVNGFYFAGLSLVDYDLPDLNIVSATDVQIESLAPLSEFYPITNGVSIAAHDNQVFVSDRDYKLPTDMFSCYAHREGMGYGNGHLRRFIPLLGVEDAKGLRSGWAAWLQIFANEAKANGELEGSMLGSFAISSEDFYDANGIAAVVETVEIMTKDIFLKEGGSDEFTYLEGKDTEIVAGGSHFALRGANTSNVTTNISLYGGNNGTQLMASYDCASTDHVAGMVNDIFRSVDRIYYLSKGKPTKAVVTLYQGGKMIDRIENDIHYWQPKPVEERNFVYVEDGYFKKGKGEDAVIVNLFGVNFGPSYRAGLSAYDGWMSPGDYDPDVIANDLARVKDIGFNAIAVWCEWNIPVESNTILDLIRQCQELGLYVDLCMTNNGPAYPLRGFNAEKVTKWIQTLRLHENDTVISYDIAWEERIGQRDGKWIAGINTVDPYIGSKDWEDDFLSWVNVQYGSLAHAQQLWGVTLPIASDTGEPYVTAAMMDDTTGEYHAVTAAYYRFLDDHVATEMIRKGMYLYDDIAPNQLVSFRMSMSGSAYRTDYFKPSTQCFDFQSLAPAFDFMSPEGYQLGVTGDAALQVAFANAYARYTNPNSPVVWKEFSANNWSGKVDSNFNPDMIVQNDAGQFVDLVLGQMYNAYTSGVYYWWTMPGLRGDENGDTGAWNPDGSDRPVTTALRKWAPIFKNQGARKAPDVTIKVERDNQAGTIYGMFDAVLTQMCDAVNAGKSIAFVDNNGSTGANNVYADTVMNYAVGGTATSGSYPMRYVNGIVKDVTKATKNGQDILLVTVCNTKQSTWRSGTVSLVSTSDSDLWIARKTINQDVAYLQDVVLEVPIYDSGDVKLRLEINGVPFGPLHIGTVH